MQNDIRPPRRPTMPARYARPIIPSRPPEEAPPSVPVQSAEPSTSLPPVQPIEAAPPVTSAGLATPVMPMPTQGAVSAAEQAEPPLAEPTAHTESSAEPPNAEKPSRKPTRRAIGVLFACAGLLAVLVLAAFGWYQSQLRAVSSDSDVHTVQLKIPEATSPSRIGEMLKQEGLIRSELAFALYVRLSGVHQNLKAGSYILSTNESTPEIAEHITTGKVEEFTLTFYPGAALRVATPTDSTPPHKKVLLDAGYEEEEIEEAFESEYDHPLLASKPAGDDIEGYIYGETYQIAAGSTVKEILVKTFDESYARLETRGVLEQLDKDSMTLHDAVILASVVEREVSTGEADQRKVSQVFNLRLEEGMPLGADATFVYAAAKLGVAPSVNLDSPYNTRKYGGLPPGPISSPSTGAMYAVAFPADSEYLYFVSGDDGKNHFSKTIEEHERKTRQYCQKNCSLF